MELALVLIILLGVIILDARFKESPGELSAIRTLCNQQLFPTFAAYLERI